MNKRSLIIIACLLLALSIMATAQTQTTENYLVTGPWTDYVVPMKYSYYVSDEGERIMNGPISISGKQNETYGNVTITGSYLLNAAAKNGKMNGTMSVKANYHGVKQLLRGQQVEDYSYSLSGSFTDGVPNGSFTAKATNYGSSIVTYKNGKLVGNYYVNEVVDDRILSIKGTLNEAGKMVGIWQLEIMGDNSTWEFANGTRIRISSKEEESTPKQIEMAKKYAAGTISEEALMKEGYFPVCDSIKLGDYASDLFFLACMVDWRKMPKYSFGQSFWVKYTYLYNILPVPERKFEEILSDYRNNGESEYPQVGFDKISNALTIEYPNNGVVLKRSFTEEQVRRIKEGIDFFCREHPLTSIYDLFSVLKLSNTGPLSRVYGIEDSFKRIQEETEKNHTTKQLEKFIQTVESVRLIASEQLKDKERTPDGNYYIIPYEGKWSQPLTARYFPVSVMEQFCLFENSVKEYHYSVVQRLEEERIAKEKAAEEERIAKEKAAEEERIAKEKAAEEERIAKEKAAEEKRSTIIVMFNESLSGIVKKPKTTVSEMLKQLIVKMGYGYYDRIPRNKLNIIPAELAEAIAPIQAYTICDIQEEDAAGYDTYRVLVRFQKKNATIPVSLSITNKGAIIDGSIELPEEVLANARNSIKTKQSVSRLLEL